MHSWQAPQPEVVSEDASNVSRIERSIAPGMRHPPPHGEGVHTCVTAIPLCRILLLIYINRFHPFSFLTSIRCWFDSSNVLVVLAQHTEPFAISVNILCLLWVMSAEVRQSLDKNHCSAEPASTHVEQARQYLPGT